MALMIDPAGQIGIMVCSKEDGRDVKTPLRAVPDTRYYNADVHRGSFLALPEFGRAMLKDGINVLPRIKPTPTATPKTTKKKVLLLGSGLVAGPAAEYIARHNHELTIACRTYATAESLCGDLPNATPMSVDVSSPDALRQAIKAHDVVVSLVPYTHHAAVMEAALVEKCAVVTTSYVNPAMRALEQKFVDAGLICYNEIGVGEYFDVLATASLIIFVRSRGRSLVGHQGYQ